MKQDKFLEKLEERLEENRQLAEKSVLPKFLSPLASYLGFNAFRVLFFLSFGLTVILSWYAFDWMILVGKKLFLFE